MGLGGSLEKLHYLPEAHTDFLLAVIGEELGLAGVLVRDRRCSTGSSSALSTSAARPSPWTGLRRPGRRKGIGIWIGVQTFINMGVNLGPAADQGPDPAADELSAASAILINCVGLAILLRIDYENRRH